MSDDIVAFIRARLDEDAEHAEGAIGDEWRFRLARGHAYVARREADDLSVVAETGDARTGWHIARHDPTRVLRGVEAKRRIVDMHVGLDYRDDGTPILLGGFGEAYWEALRALASEWSTHPDYRTEWTP